MISSMIATIVIIMVMAVNTYGHYGKSREIRRINGVMIRRIIRHINGGIYILDDGSLFHYNDGGCCRGSSSRSCSRSSGRFRSNIPGIRSGRRSGGFWFNYVILSI
jgi:hypothetical protein